MPLCVGHHGLYNSGNTMPWARGVTAMRWFSSESEEEGKQTEMKERKGKGKGKGTKRRGRGIEGRENATDVESLSLCEGLNERKMRSTKTATKAKGQESIVDGTTVGSVTPPHTSGALETTEGEKKVNRKRRVRRESSVASTEDVTRTSAAVNVITAESERDISQREESDTVSLSDNSSIPLDTAKTVSKRVTRKEINSSTKREKVELRPYQKECVTATIELWREGEEEGRRQLVSLPVGSGKTVILAEIMRRLSAKSMAVADKPQAKRFLLLAHRAELLDQAYDVIRRVCPSLKIGIDRAEQRCDVSKVDVVLASVQTLGRNVEVTLTAEGDSSGAGRLGEYDPDMFRAVFIDEAHHATSPTYLRILDYLGVRQRGSHVRLWGCTATAKRHDGVALGSVFTNVPFYISPVELMDEGYLTQIKAWRVFSPDLISPSSDAATLLEETVAQLGVEKDFTADQLNTMNTPERNAMVVSAYHQIVAPDRSSTLVFACSIAHCYDLLAAFEEYFEDPRAEKWNDQKLKVSAHGEEVYKAEKSLLPCKKNSRRAAVVTGSTPSEERVNTVEAFRQGKIAVLINVGVFTEGTDLPVTDSLVLARPTASANLYYQMLGRGLRVYAGKQDCLVLDIVDLLGEHVGDLRQLTAPELFGIPPSYQTMGKDLRQAYDEYTAWLQQKLMEDKRLELEQMERQQQHLAEAKELPLAWKDLRYDQGALESIDAFAEYDWVAVRREGSTAPTFYCSFDPVRSKLGYLEITEEQPPTTVKVVPPLAYAWDGRHKRTGMEDLERSGEVENRDNIASGSTKESSMESERRKAAQMSLHPSIQMPTLGGSERKEREKKTGEDSDIDRDSYEALVGLDAIEREEELSKTQRYSTAKRVPSATLFRATYRRPGGAKAARPMQAALGSDLREVRKAGEEFLAMNFPNELQFQRKDAEWRAQPPSEQQVFFARRLRQFPTSKGEISTTSRIRQLRKLTEMRVRDVTAYMRGQDDNGFEESPGLAALLKEEPPQEKDIAGDPAMAARQRMAASSYQWFEAYKAKKPLRFILPLSFKEYTALEVSQNMLNLWDVWKIVDSDRKLLKLSKKAEQELLATQSTTQESSESPPPEPLDMKSLKGAILLAEHHLTNVAPKSQLKFLQNPRKAKWKLEPATDKQKQFLVSLGYEGDDIHHLSKGQISRLISRYKAQKTY